MINNSRKVKIYKIVVAGHFNSGKTTFIKTVSKGNFLSSERKTSLKGEVNKKETTTVAMDFATVEARYVKYFLFGIPGQYRFNFMWEILAKDANGFILLLDSSDPTRWPELFRQVLLFRRINPNSPIIIAANKQDQPNAMSVEEIRKKLNNLGGYEIIPVVAQDYESAFNLLKIMKQRIDQNYYCEVEEASA